MARLPCRGCPIRLGHWSALDYDVCKGGMASRSLSA